MRYGRNAGRLGVNLRETTLEAGYIASAVSAGMGLILSSAAATHPVTLIKPTSNVAVECYGVTLYETDSDGADISVVTGGQVEAIAGDTLTFGDEVALLGTTARMWKARAGEPVAGTCLQAATVGQSFKMFLAPTPGTGMFEIDNDGTQITADAEITTRIPAGTYVIDHIAGTETAGNAITGGLDVGTASGGAQIGNNLAVSASTLYDYYGASLATTIVTVAACASVFLSAETNWNSASIRFNLMLCKVY